MDGFVTFAATVFLIFAGGWDLYQLIWLKTPLSAGKTASWWCFSNSRKYPALALGFGFATAFVVMYAAYPVSVTWLFVMGHIFGLMRGEIE